MKILISEVNTPIWDGFNSSLASRFSKNYFANETTQISLSTSNDSSSDVIGNQSEPVERLHQETEPMKSDENHPEPICRISPLLTVYKGITA